MVAKSIQLPAKQNFLSQRVKEGNESHSVDSSPFSSVPYVWSNTYAAIAYCCKLKEKHQLNSLHDITQ